MVLLALLHMRQVHKFVSKRTLMQWLLWECLVCTCSFLLTAFRAQSRTTSVLISWIEGWLPPFISSDVFISEVYFRDNAFLFARRHRQWCCTGSFWLIITAEIRISCCNSVGLIECSCGMRCCLVFVNYKRDSWFLRSRLVSTQFITWTIQQFNSLILSSRAHESSHFIRLLPIITLSLVEVGGSQLLRDEISNFNLSCLSLLRLLGSWNAIALDEV